MSYVNKRFDGLQIFHFHLGHMTLLNGEQGEPRQRLHIRIAFELESKYACDAYGRAKSSQTQIDHTSVVGVLQANAKSGQERRPCELEHRHNVLTMLGAGKVGRYVTHGFHEGTRRRLYLFHFHVEEDSALFFGFSSRTTTANSALSIQLAAWCCARIAFS